MRELISPWGKYLKEFFEYKKLCGYKYEKPESILFLFDRYYAGLNISELKFTRDIVEPFLYLKPNERITNQSQRVCVMRQFGKYLFLNDIIKNVYIIPPFSLKGAAEYIPYIYSKDELIGIISYLENYKSSNISGSFQPSINMINAVTTAMKVLISTGMRLGEALNLRLKDIDFENKLIVINVSKNDKKRIIPISVTLINELKNYIRNTPFYIAQDNYLFQIAYDNQLDRANMHYYFYKALKACNIRHTKNGPRIHDFRHCFSVMCLTQMQENEEDINNSLIYLSAYLGHKSIYETQKYVWLTPSLFKEIKKKMEDYSSFIMEIFGGEKFDEE